MENNNYQPVGLALNDKGTYLSGFPSKFIPIFEFADFEWTNYVIVLYTKGWEGGGGLDHDYDH